MKKFVFAAALLGMQMVLAAPFVYSPSWTAEPNPANKRGGEYRTAMVSDPKTMNPFITAELVSIPNVMAMGAGLFKLDPLDTEEWIPLMAAEAPKISNEGKRFVVKIRPGMKFSDGQEITADDWVTTANIHKDEKVGSNSYDTFYINKKPITVKKLDKYTLQFDFPQVSAIAYATLAYAPWPDHIFGPVYKNKGAAGIRAMWGVNAKVGEIVTPGMWDVESYRPGEKVTYTKNKYFGEWNKDSRGNPLPYLDRYSQLILPDQNAAAAAFLTGKIDTYAPRNPDEVTQIRRAIDNKTLKGVLFPNVSSEASSVWITFNWNKSSNPFKQRVFRDPRFRQAMSHIANRKAMIELALGGLGTESYFSVYPIFKGWIPSNLTTYKYDPKAAAKLLADMGFKKNKDGWLQDASGNVLEFSLNTNAGNLVREQAGRIFADEAKKIGVKVNFKPIDFNNIVDMMRSKGDDRKFDAIMLAITGGNGGNIWPFQVNVLPCGANLHAYNQPANGSCLSIQETGMSKLYLQGDATLDRASRKKLAAQLLRLETNLQPFIYLFASNYHVTFNDRLGGEYPRNVMNAVVGPREVALTFVK